MDSLTLRVGLGKDIDDQIRLSRYKMLSWIDLLFPLDLL